MCDARKHNTLFFEHNPADPNVDSNWPISIERISKNRLVCIARLIMGVAGS